MSLFDPTSFLNAPINEALATKREPLPTADAVEALVAKQEMVNGEKDGKPWYKLNVQFEITDRDYLAKAPGSPEKAFITWGIMLDMTEQGTLAFGPNKNVKLGQLREATGSNMPGKSLADNVGRIVKIKIGHRVDGNDSSLVYEDVKGVIPA